MKTLSIGRESGCDIIVNDASNVVSRRHAILTITALGKMTITDLSHNGTYVNGIRIASNVPVPITRKDTVSFAKVARLDWADFPNPLIRLYYIIGAVAVALLLIVALVCFVTCGGKHEPAPTPSGVNIDMVHEHEQELKDKEKARKDSICKVVEDSISKVSKKNAPKPTSISVKDGKEKHKSLNKEDKASDAKCSVCGKKMTDCEYKGQHPAEKRTFR